MLMPTKATESGKITPLSPGTVISAGDLLVSLELKDPSKVKKILNCEGAFDATAVDIETDSKDAANNILTGYKGDAEADATDFVSASVFVDAFNEYLCIEPTLDGKLKDDVVRQLAKDNPASIETVDINHARGLKDARNLGAKPFAPLFADRGRDCALPDARLIGMDCLLAALVIFAVVLYMGRVYAQTESRRCPIIVMSRPGKLHQPVGIHRRTSMRLFHKRALIAALPFFVALFQPELVASGVSASGDSAGSIGGSTASDPNDAKTDGREAVGKGEGVFSAFSGFVQRASHQLYGDTDESRSSAGPGGEHYQQSKSAAAAVGGDATGTTSAGSAGSASHATEVGDSDANR
jgi:hypothetical protein